MKRIHAVELEDLPGFPGVIREAGLAYLRFATEKTGQVDPMVSVVADALAKSGETEIIDLCSGGGGPILSLVEKLVDAGVDVRVTLTDLYPSTSAREHVEAVCEGRARYEAEPVSAFDVGADRPGLRTLFNAFHHFRPEDGIRVLRNSVEAGRPIVIIEVVSRRLLAMIGIFFSPLAVFLTVPFLRPFRPIWLVLTYLIPVIPIFVMWDGLVSCLRVYTREEITELAAEADPEGRFDWEFSDVPISHAPIPMAAFVGLPKSRAE